MWCCAGVLFALENIGDPPWVAPLEIPSVFVEGLKQKLVDFKAKARDGRTHGICRAPNYSNMGCTNPRNFQDWGNNQVLMRGKQLSLADATWFIITSVFTVGYGDMRPYTFLGRLATYSGILFVSVIIPTQLQNIVDLFACTTTSSRRCVVKLYASIGSVVFQ